MNTGCVYLIGAGCGPADLITLRGMERLRRCDAVVYDDLIDPRLLELVPEGAERLYMGKRQGRHSASQSDISAKLVALAREGKVVARLKGGDPFVFGRGGEEILALQAAGIPYEEIPGISSAIAIPALAGIPVTHRGASQSLHIVTGHTAHTPDALPSQLDKLAGLEGTLVFLMGLSQLPQLAARLLAAGKDPDTPAAVISGGNAPHPATVRGTLADIADLAREVQPPAVIVVGQVAGLDLSSTLSGPLDGVRVGITGTEAVTGRLEEALTGLGASVTLAERSLLLELEPDLEFSVLADGAPHWLVFTSANGVRLFFRRLREQGLDLRRLHACKFAVIGAATGEALAQHGIRADLCPAQYTSRGLGLALRETAKPEEDIFLLRSLYGSPVLPALLHERGLSVHEIPLYDLQSDPEIARQTAHALPSLDYLTFSSASGVDLFFRQYGALPSRARCVCIGEVTAQALLDRGGPSPLVPADTSVQGMVQSILADCQSPR